MSAGRSPGEAADDRGRLTIADTVLEKLAGAAAGEVEGAGRARARVRRTADRLDVGLTLALTYPTPVARTADAAREHVSARVAELAGLAVGRVDVAVSSLAPATTASRTGRVVA